MAIANPLAGSFDGARRAFDNLNERERKLVAVLGAVVVAIAVLLPVYLMTSAISDIEDQNHAITEVLRDIARARPQLKARAAARKAALARYEQPTPELRRFIEAKGDEVGLSVQETTGQPEKVVGQFTRRHLRVNLPNVSIKPIVQLMAAVDNSPYPVAVTRLQVEHFRTGDQYNVQLDVISYDKKGSRRHHTTKGHAVPSGTAGPPAP